MSETYDYSDLKDLPKIAEQILSLQSKSAFFIFNGPMGAGKTTLIKELCKQLGAEDLVSSPTYNIVNEYRTMEGKRICHFDFYRIEDKSELYDLGYEEYFYSDSICFVEWPEKVGNLLPSEHIAVNLSVERNRRSVSFEVINNK
ncbi:MAG: tRNA (adenosine(37)-N6)-threonylcarbamoyltransferase complex ATPase subunit type 1 TsaE [Flavobacteriales bacterium]|nr:tRNA (adenosine(37)-N6)-threonylcarbamoyltransferase complex ATPase subunit type 1 TsaE [Flavobacteriales bacterium]